MLLLFKSFWDDVRKIVVFVEQYIRRPVGLNDISGRFRLHVEDRKSGMGNTGCHGLVCCFNTIVQHYDNSVCFLIAVLPTILSSN